MYRFFSFFKGLDRFLWVLTPLAPLVKRKSLGPARGSIGIIKLAALGDVLCLLPSLRELKKAYPQSKVLWLTTYRTNPRLFRSLPFVDDIYVIEPSVNGLLSLARFLWKEPVDVVLDFDQYYRSSELLAFFWGRGNSMGFSTPPKGDFFALSVKYDPAKNEKLVFYDLVLALQGKVTDSERSIHYVSFDPKVPEILPTPSSELTPLLEEVASKNKGFVAIYPGSSSTTRFRRWGIDKYIQVARMCLQSNYAVVFIGGKDEEEYKEVIKNEFKDRKDCYDSINLLSLEDTICLLSKACLLVSNDGGLVHFCDLIGLPSVTIFGPSIGSKWSPLTNGHLIERTNLPCKPCIRTHLAEVPRSCRTQTLECLEAISVQEVFDACKQTLDNDSKTPGKGHPCRSQERVVSKPDD